MRHVMGALSMPPRQRFAPHVCSPTTCSYTHLVVGPQSSIVPYVILIKKGMIHIHGSGFLWSSINRITLQDSSLPAAVRKSVFAAASRRRRRGVRYLNSY